MLSSGGNFAVSSYVVNCAKYWSACCGVNCVGMGYCRCVDVVVPLDVVPVVIPSCDVVNCVG